MSVSVPQLPSPSSASLPLSRSLPLAPLSASLTLWSLSLAVPWRPCDLRVRRPGRREPGTWHAAPVVFALSRFRTEWSVHCITNSKENLNPNHCPSRPSVRTERAGGVRLSSQIRRSRPAPLERSPGRALNGSEPETERHRDSAPSAGGAEEPPLLARSARR